MAEADYTRGEMDTSSQQGTFEGVMKFTGIIGLPFCLALTAFFSSLTVGAGLASVPIFIAVYVFVFFAVKLFF